MSSSGKDSSKSFAIALAYNNHATISFDQNHPYDNGYQQQQNKQGSRFSANKGSNKNETDNNLDDKIINNVNVEIYLVAPNRGSANFNVQTIDLRNEKTVLGVVKKGNVAGNNTSSISNLQNPASFKIDLEKGTVNELSNDQRFPSRITNQENITMFRKPIVKINGNNEDEIHAKDFEKILFEEVKPTTNSLVTWLNVDNLAKTIEDVSNKQDEGIEFLASSHIFEPILNSVTLKQGKLGSSHIIDYSEFLTKSVPVKTNTVAANFEAAVDSFEQTSITTAAVTTSTTLPEGEILLALTPSKTSSQQNSTVAVNFDSKKLEQEESDETEITSTQTMISTTTECISVSQSTLPFELIKTSTTTLLPEKTTPELIIFLNKTRIRINDIIGHDEITLKFNTNNKSSQKQDLSVSSIENITILPKANLGSTRAYPFLAVGDKTVLDEQNYQVETSSKLPLPHIVVGEQISEKSETHPSDSPEDERIERQTAITSFLSNLTDNSLDFRVLQTDFVTQETEVSRPDALLSTEKEFTTTEPNYLESIDPVNTSDSKVMIVDSEGVQKKKKFTELGIKI
uniref:Uncharacterized protein n=1 Tax=Setaria digitata TaxID=48799 RepID=A0A915Q4K9_9BILA